MVWIIFIGVLIFILRGFISRDQVFTQQVDSYGGMRKKYSTIINAILQGDSIAQITNSTRDEIIIYCQGDYGLYTRFIIKEAPRTTHIFWECDSGPLGKLKMNLGPLYTLTRIYD